MSDVTITYKGANIATMDTTGSILLQTAGTYCEGDIGVEYVKPGGGPVSVPAKEVNFRDYDGTVVYSYTPAEFAALEAMPANPDHSGDTIPLTAQGWNWSLSDAQTYVAKYGRLEVGQMYATTDGKTHVLIHLEQGRTSPILGCCPNGTVDVDWGDGTAHDTLTGTSVSTVKWTPTHNYAAPGDYDIKLTCTGTMGFYGSSTSNEFSGLLRYTQGADQRNISYQGSIQAVYSSDSVTNINNYAFCRYCTNLALFTMPRSVVSIEMNAFQNCYALPAIVIPDTVAVIGSSALSSCYLLRHIAIPKSVTTLDMQALSYGYGRQTIIIPDSITTIANYAFTNCYSLTSVIIPDSVTSIGAQVFYNCYSVSEYHFHSNTPPTLNGTNVFYNIAADCVMYVPYSADHSILNAYKTETNWSTLASHMQEEPQ